MIEFLTEKEAREKWNVSGCMVTIHCNQGKIEGEMKKGKATFDLYR